MKIAITGGSSGIGWETAKALLEKGHELTFLVRNVEKMRSLLEENNIQQSYQIIECDLAHLSSVGAAAQEIKQQQLKLDVLINNAGGTFEERKESKDGFELHFAVNHLGHFYLFHQLESLLEQSQTKIINVSSEAHKAAKVNFDDLNLEKDYSSIKAYGNAKLYNILFTKSLADKGFTSYALHPGVIDSSFGDNLNGFFKLLWKLGKPFMKSAREGATTSIYLAINSLSSDMNGQYFKDRKPASCTKAAKSERMRKQLWEKSLAFIDKAEA